LTYTVIRQPESLAMKSLPRFLAFVASSLAAASFAVAQPPAATPIITSTDPAVQALLDTKPSTPVDLYEVIQLLLKLEEPAAARPLLAQLLETATEPGPLVALGRKFGRDELERFGTTPTLQPQAKEFAARVLAALSQADRDPERIAQLIARLQTPSYEARVAAINGLRGGGEVATAALIDVLNDPSRAAEHALVRVALAATADTAIGPLRAMLASGNEATMLAVVQTLALVEDDFVLNDLYLAAFPPSSPAAVRAQAQAALAKRLKTTLPPMDAAAKLMLTAETLYRRNAPPLVETTETWRWNAETKRPEAIRLPARVEELQRAAQFADAASAIAGGDSTARRLASAALLEAAQRQPSDPSQASALLNQWAADRRITPGDLEALYDLTYALERYPTTAAIVSLLGVSAPADQLLTSLGGRPTLLVRAATSADPTVRFAAVGAIFNLKPTQPFVGSSGVADSLAWFASAEGVDRVLVVDHKAGRARDVAAMLTGTLRAEAYDDVAAALQAAATQADVRLVLVERSLVEPSQGNFLARLRADYRSRGLPVGVVCEPEEVERFRSRYYADPLTFALYRPTSAEQLQRQFSLNPVPESATMVDNAERLRRAKAALAAMQTFLETKNTVFNLRPYEAQLLAATTSPELATAALGVLGRLGSATVQRTLVETASATARPLELRQAAAAAFIENVRRFGTLLTIDEIRLQYDRYNASETLDAPTQELLGAVLDAIELRADKNSLVTPTKKLSADAPTP
jgi:hypothetical protein